MRIKSILACAAALALLLSLAGCGIGGEYDVLDQPAAPAEPVDTPEPTDEPEPTEEPEPSEEPEPTEELEPTEEPEPSEEPEPTDDTALARIFGAVDGDIYTNEYFGLTFTPAADWHFFTQEELAGRVDAAVSNPALDEDTADGMDAFMQSESNACVMGAYTEDGLQNVNVIVEYLSALGKYISEEQLVTIALNDLGVEPGEDASMLGLEGVQVEPNTFPLAGEEHGGLRLTYTDSSHGIDVTTHLQIVFIIEGEYAMQITMGSTFEEEPLEDIAGLFAPLETE